MAAVAWRRRLCTRGPPRRSARVGGSKWSTAPPRWPSSTPGGCGCLEGPTSRPVFVKCTEARLFEKPDFQQPLPCPVLFSGWKEDPFRNHRNRAHPKSNPFWCVCFFFCADKVLFLGGVPKSALECGSHRKSQFFLELHHRFLTSCPK